MNINESFPPAFLRSEDIKDKTVAVKIRLVEAHDFGEKEGTKPVVYFEGKDAGLVLNKTRANAIRDLFGEETDGWTGKTIILTTGLVPFEGRMTDSIFCTAPTNSTPKPEPAKPAYQVEDDVPF
jgi:hypothetical protein